MWRPPTGPGIRVDSGVTEGDRVPAEFDSMIAKVVAWGDDREEALCRLRRALTATVVVIEGGATNRTFLLGLLRQPELTAGPVHNRWLDGLVAADSHLPRWDPLAVALAAIESYDRGHAEDVAAYHEPALRGRPRLSRGAGRQVSLSYRENRYRVSVFRTGPDTYLVDGGREVAELRVTHRDGPQRQVSCGGRVHRCTVAPGTTSFTIDIDDEASHRVYVDDDDDVIRARFPAFVIAVLAAEGDQVAAGDAVILLESMKMETAVTAAVSGTVTGLHVRVGTQVVLGDPMVTICGTSAPSGPVSALTGLPAAGKTHDVYAALSSYLLGFDVAGGAVEPHLAAQRELGARAPRTIRPCSRRSVSSSHCSQTSARCAGCILRSRDSSRPGRRSFSLISLNFRMTCGSRCVPSWPGTSRPASGAARASTRPRSGCPAPLGAQANSRRS